MEFAFAEFASLIITFAFSGELLVSELVIWKVKVLVARLLLYDTICGCVPTVIEFTTK